MRYCPLAARDVRQATTREGNAITTNQTYVKTELVGSSNKSVSDAIESAIATASRSLRNLDWFEVGVAFGITRLRTTRSRLRLASGMNQRRKGEYSLERDGVSRT